MLDTLVVNFHGKRHTDFVLIRIIKAEAQGFDLPVTAYLCGVSIKARAGIGVVFGHKRKDRYGRFGDGHLIRTSDVLKVEREGRFWVMTTVNSRYVLATFQRENGRASLRDYLRLSQTLHQTPPILQ
jgi:hypothetical protein